MVTLPFICFIIFLKQESPKSIKLLCYNYNTWIPKSDNSTCHSTHVNASIKKIPSPKWSNKSGIQFLPFSSDMETSFDIQSIYLRATLYSKDWSTPFSSHPSLPHDPKHLLFYNNSCNYFETMILVGWKNVPPTLLLIKGTFKHILK